MAKIIGSSNAVPDGRISATSTVETPEDTVANGAWKSFLIAKMATPGSVVAPESPGDIRTPWWIFSSTNQIGPEDVLGFAEAPGRAHLVRHTLQGLGI